MVFISICLSDHPSLPSVAKGLPPVMPAGRYRPNPRKSLLKLFRLSAYVAESEKCVHFSG